jgi:POT family proton-dependent oligopeptide transporter
LHGHAEPTNPEILKEKFFVGINKEYAIYIISILSVGVIWFLVQSNSIVHSTLNIMAIGILAWLVWFLYTQCDAIERGRMTVLAGLTIFTVVFWALFEQSAASMTLYADRVVDRVFWNQVYNEASMTGLYAFGLILIFIPIAVGFFGRAKYSAFNSAEKKIVGGVFALVGLVLIYSGINTFLFAGSLSGNNAGVPVIWEMTAVQTGSLNAMFIFLLAPLFAVLWSWLSKNKWEPNTSIKFALGILQAGLGFGALVVGASMPEAGGKVALIWLVLAYLLHTTGELCLSPVGLSAVTKLAVPKVVGVMMGAWFLATAYSELVATQIAKFAAIDTQGGEVTDIAAALVTYTDFFSSLMYVGVGISIILFFISPLMKKGMHGMH